MLMALKGLCCARSQNEVLALSVLLDFCVLSNEKAQVYLLSTEHFSCEERNKDCGTMRC